MSKTEKHKTRRRPRAHLIAMAAVLAAVASPAIAADNRQAITAEEFDRGLACVDEANVKASLYGLRARLDAMVGAGLATPVALTEMREGNQPVLDYQPVGPFSLLGRQPLGINWAYGMLPAVTAIFDGPLDELMQAYERTGFAFACQTYGSRGDRSCEAQRPAEDGRLVVALFEGRSVLPEGRVVVACTLVNGNPFR